MEDGVSSQSENDRTKEITEDSCPKVAPVGNVVDTCGNGDNLSTYLGNKAAQEEEGNGVGRKFVETKRHGLFLFVKISNVANAFADEIFDGCSEVVAHPGNQHSDNRSKNGSI